MPPPPLLAQVAYLFALATSLGSAGCGRSTDREFNAPANTQVDSASGDYAFVEGKSGHPGKPDQVGLASWYGQKFNGKRTASGERYDARAMTAAHRKLPFGTWVEVRRVDT